MGFLTEVPFLPSFLPLHTPQPSQFTSNIHDLTMPTKVQRYCYAENQFYNWLEWKVQKARRLKEPRRVWGKMERDKIKEMKHQRKVQSCDGFEAFVAEKNLKYFEKTGEGLNRLKRPSQYE